MNSVSCRHEGRERPGSRQANFGFEIVCWHRVGQRAANWMDLELADIQPATQSRDQYIY